MHARERVAIRPSKFPSRGDDVEDRRRREEDDAGVGLPDGCRDRGCGQGARGGDIHIGRDRQGAERGTEQRERGEAGHESGVFGHREVTREHIPEGAQLAMGVDHALGGAGRPRGEQDRGLVVWAGRCGKGEVAAARDDVAEAM